MKKPISATVEEDLIRWLNLELKNNKKYRNKSHLIEMALEKLKSEDER